MWPGGLGSASAPSDVDVQRVAACRCWTATTASGANLRTSADGPRHRTAQKILDSPVRDVMDPPFPVVDGESPVALLTTLLSRTTTAAFSVATARSWHRDALRPAASAGGHPLMRITCSRGARTSERAVAFASAIPRCGRARGGPQASGPWSISPVASWTKPAERELLGGAVGLTPPSVDALVERERRMLSEGPRSSEPVRNAEVLFLAVHGGPWKGARCSVLDVIAVPTRAAGAGKRAGDGQRLVKRLFGPPACPSRVFMAPVGSDDVSTGLGWPVIVKPSKQGSSVGLTLDEEGPGLGRCSRWRRATTRSHGGEFIAGRN